MPSLLQTICDVFHGIEEYHDFKTEQHELRVGILMGALAKAMGFDEERCKSLSEIGSIHDVGKIAIPSSILSKPGSLSVCERKIVELHPIVGHRFIKKIVHPQAKLAGIVILNHHENYDGTGYPNGLSGNAIPLEAAMCRICDVYDALRTRRPYRAALSHQAVFEMMYDACSNGMYHAFNPELMDIFKSISQEIKQLHDA